MRVRGKEWRVSKYYLAQRTSDGGGKLGLGTGKILKTSLCKSGNSQSRESNR